MAKGERTAGIEARDAERAARPPERHIIHAPLMRQCLECGTEFKIGPGPGRHKTFCQIICRSHYASRCAARGKVLIPYAMAWRVGRYRKKIKDNGRFAEMIAILDSFVDEDRKAGRPMPDDYVERMLGTGFGYIDRKRG